MIIDSHLHVWNDAAANVEVLLATMRKEGIEKACIVQPIGQLYDNSYVAECLARHPRRFAGIALMDRQRPDAAEELERLVVEDGFDGLRMHLARADDPAEWAAADQYPIWEKAAQLGACFLSFGPAEQQPAIEPIVARYPTVKVILDHLGGARAEEPTPNPLLDNVLGLAKYPNVFVKFTPQAINATTAFPFRSQHAAYQRVYDAFGPSRLMWGTDFPYILQNIGYGKAVDLFHEQMDFLGEDDKEWLFAKTAQSVWRFGGAAPPRN